MYRAKYRAKRPGKDRLHYRFMDTGRGRARFDKKLDKKVAAPKPGLLLVSNPSRNGC